MRGKPPWDVPCPRCRADVAISCFDGPRWLNQPHPERVHASLAMRASRSGHDGWKIAVAVAAFILIVLTVWAFADPGAQLPVISKVVCSVKGGTWYDGNQLLGIQPGCYARTQP